MNLYQATLTLHCKSDHPATQDRFKEIWTDTLRSRWTFLIFLEAGKDPGTWLYNDVNEELLAAMQVELVGATDVVNPFASVWKAGPNGLHESTSPVRLQGTDGVNSWDWMIGTPPDDAPIYVTSAWRKVTS